MSDQASNPTDHVHIPGEWRGYADTTDAPRGHARGRPARGCPARGVHLSARCRECGMLAVSCPSHAHGRPFWVYGDVLPPRESAQP